MRLNSLVIVGRVFTIGLLIVVYALVLSSNPAGRALGHGSETRSTR